MSAPSLEDTWGESGPRNMATAISDIRHWLLELEGTRDFSRLDASLEVLSEVLSDIEDFPTFGDPLFDLIGPALNDCKGLANPGPHALNVPETLSALFGFAVDDDDATLGVIVASNPNCPSELLALMAESDLEWEDASVRAAVASHPSTPATLLEGLAQDEDAGIRWAVAGNPKTPVLVLETLAFDSGLNFFLRYVSPLSEAEVRVAVANNASTPRWLLEKQLQQAEALLSADPNDEGLRHWQQTVEHSLSAR